MTSSPNYPDDPGRDPEGLEPPRDILDAPEGVGTEGSYEPGRRTQPSQAEEPPDQPPTSTRGTGP